MKKIVNNNKKYRHLLKLAVFFKLSEESYLDQEHPPSNNTPQNKSISSKALFQKLRLRLRFPSKVIVVFDTKSINCEVRTFYLPICVLLPPSGIAPGGCFPRARPQPPRETHSAGSSDTCYSRRSHRPPPTRTSEIV